MNACIRTGIYFRFAGDAAKRTGDLFYHSGAFCIRGIPPETHDRPADVLIADAPIVKRGEREHYSDISDVTILAISERFREHIRKWYPELVDAFVAVPLLNRETA